MASVANFVQNGYEAVRVIGQGRFGSVFQVRSVSEIHRMSVCKVIHLESLGEIDRRLAEQEASVLRSLDHPTIVKFEDAFRMLSGTSLGLIMEYCDGGDLRHAIRLQSNESGYFPEQQILTWFTQIVEGLRYIHAHRIIHRDLKTSNIFLKGPPPYRCLIGDFGISRVLEETLSSAHTVIGTPYYLSPEVCKREPYTTKSDMWSLGACLYEMAMLKMAFKCSNLLSLVSRIIHEAYEPIDSNHFSTELICIVDRLLSKKPEERPAAAQLLRERYISQFSQEQAEEPPLIFAPVDIKRRPTLRSRAGSRQRITTVIPEEVDMELPSQEPEADLNEESCIPFVKPDESNSINSQLLPTEIFNGTTKSQLQPPRPPLTRF